MTSDNWVRTKSDEAAVDEGCVFDINAADRVRRFFAKFLRHSKGQFAGKPFELLDWQWDRVIAPLYGWRRADGRRRFTRAAIGIPKKNGKSTLLAGLGLYHLVADGEKGAEVYSAAADRDQAGIIYNEAATMVDASPVLRHRIEVVRSRKVLNFSSANGIYKALSRDVPTKEGLNISCLLFDELHSQPDRKLWDCLRYGGAARRQPMLIWISTAGHDKGSLCYEQWQYALGVQRSEIVDTSLLAVIYETPMDADWTSPATWQAANPSWGQTIGPDSFREDCAEAQRSPASESSFRRYRLNTWVDAETRWIAADAWSACQGGFVAKDLEKKPCIVGLDLSTTTDITAAVLVFREGDHYRILPRFWVPRETMRTRERENRVRLDEWARKGLVQVTDQPTVDYGEIRAWVGSLPSRYAVKEIAIDPWNATQLATQLVEDGHEVTYVRMGYGSISAATKEFEKLVLSGMIRHDGNPVMTWMVANCMVEQDAAGNVKPSKRKSTEKIDGVVAAILALARWIVAAEKRKSKYSTSRLEAL
jgi:phage terminase large subunit-like protein